MPFDRDQVADLLARCKRRCCICYRFCGVKMETDHIVPVSEGGTDEIANAIPVCFDCHAEIHTYNPDHPRGRRFTAQELRLHREAWLNFCSQHPGALSAVPVSDGNVGPLQALIDEMEFNLAVASKDRSSLHMACPFRDHQFARAIDAGAISVLHPEIKRAIIEAYVALGATNAKVAAWVSTMSGHGSRSGSMSGDVGPRIEDSRKLIEHALSQLNSFLGQS